jgi:hypothetical protein
MLTPAQEANTKARVQILSDMSIWKSFDGYFYNDWQRKEILKRLAYADVDLQFPEAWVSNFAWWGGQKTRCGRAFWRDVVSDQSVGMRTPFLGI